MSTTDKSPVVQFGLTLNQKLLWLSLPVMLSVFIVISGPLLTGPLGTVIFVALGIVLGLITFFISAGWGYKLEITDSEIKISDKRVNFTIPLDKVGMVTRNNAFPFPTLWIVIRATGVGNEIPAKGVDVGNRQLIEAYQRRNPGREVRYVPVPGAHIRSVSGFVQELKRRIPPLQVDERLGVK